MVGWRTESMYTSVPSSSRRVPSGAMRATCSRCLMPARLRANACTSHALPSASQNGAGSIHPFAAFTSTGASHGPRGSRARTMKIPRSGSPQ